MATKKGGPVKKSKSKKKKRKVYESKKTMFRELFEILMYGLSLLIFCKGYAWQNFQIPTPSMENTLLIGDHITANTFIYRGKSELDKKILPHRDPKRGDVVVFKWPGDERQDWIKRCVGLPGDQFEIISDLIYIDGEPLNEPYPFYKTYSVQGQSDRDPEIAYRPIGYYEMKPGIDNAVYLANQTINMRAIRATTERTLSRYREKDPEVFAKIQQRLRSGDPDRIPEGFYFLMGDNRNRSSDSRDWGMVPREFIEGRAYWVWWSYGEDEGSHEKRGFDLIWSYLRVPITFWYRTHWKETFSLIK